MGPRSRPMCGVKVVLFPYACDPLMSKRTAKCYFYPTIQPYLVAVEGSVVQLHEIAIPLHSRWNVRVLRCAFALTPVLRRLTWASNRYPLRGNLRLWRCRWCGPPVRASVWHSSGNRPDVSVESSAWIREVASVCPS